MKKMGLSLFAVISLWCSAAMAAPGINPKWFSGGFCIDNGNQSGCASDANTGTDCTCSGGGSNHGPLKTFAQLWYNLLGCNAGGLCPRWVRGGGLVNAEIQFLSSDTAEYIDINAVNENLSGVIFKGVLDASKTVGTSTLTSFTARPSNRTTGVINARASGLYKAAISGITLAQTTQIIFDSTNPSYFYPYYDITTSGGSPGSGDTWAFSQPILGSFDPFASQLPAEVVIASGDAVTVYTPPVVLLSTAMTHVYASAAGNSPAANVTFEFLTIGNSSSNTVNANNGVSFAYCGMGSNLQIIPGSNGINTLLAINAPLAAVDLNNSTAGFGGQQNLVLGGIFGTPTSPAQDVLTISGASIDGDAIFGQAPGVYSGSLSNFIGRVYIDTGTSFLIYPGAQATFASVPITPFTPAGTQLWGPGGLQAFSQATVIYPFGSSQAAATFTNVSGITLFAGLSASKGCYVNASSVSPTISCNLTTNTATLDSTLGTTAGCLFSPGGGTICN